LNVPVSRTTDQQPPLGWEKELRRAKSAGSGATQQNTPLKKSYQRENYSFFGRHGLLYD